MIALPATTDATGTPEWAALRARARELRKQPLGKLVDEPGRYQRLACSAAGLLLDLTRQRLCADTVDLLLALAERCGFAAWREALFSGAPVNNTEDRAALHMALRAGADASYAAAGEAVMPAVLAERERMLGLAADIRAGRRLGYDGQPFSDVVNIGIGGSDLGAVMATAALREPGSDGPRLHFVSNVDGLQFAELAGSLDPARTLFVVCSKSFTTLETRLNAEAARRWLLQSAPESAVARHFVAVSVNEAAMDAFGIAPELRLHVWDWVGGRFSLWSSVGLAIAIAVGPAAFRELLAGAAAMDEHFRRAEAGLNLPLLLGLVAVWNRNFLGLNDHAVLPYCSRLHRLPAFLQQLEMESLGKHVSRDGRPLKIATGPVIWGEPGSNAQHSFFQLLHQGSCASSLDFIAPALPPAGGEDAHLHNLANMLAQAEAFARGVSEADALESLLSAGLPEAEARRLAPHKEHRGGRPSSLILLPRLDARHLGALIALYEHKVFVQGVIWGINPFDQWGVELGKLMAREVYTALARGDGEQLPPVGRELLHRLGRERSSA